MTARLLALKGLIAATDSTFNFEMRGTSELLVGKCLMCRRKKVAWEGGDWSPVLTIEHIEPRHHGGGDSVMNLGLACDSCNHRKGRRIDILKADDPQRQATVASLIEERQGRLRQPLMDPRLGPLVSTVLAWTEKDPQWMHLEVVWGKKS